MADIVWGLDIGGTKSAIVAGDKSGNVLQRYQVATGDYYGQWQRMLDDLISKPTASYPQAIGISCGGPLDSKRGLILSPPNLPLWDDVPIVDYLTERAHVPVFLQNDANAGALAEWRFGAGRGCRSMVFLTFGTGLGAGLILDGRLYAGKSDMAGEAGHIRLAPDGPVGYGKAGSFEGFCSGGGLRQLSKHMLGQDLSAKELVERANRGDGGAIRVLHESAQRLGQGLSILIDLLDPERIVIGSVYARAERWFREEAWRVIREEALVHSYSRCEIIPAQLGERIGDMAALTVAWNGLGAQMA